MNIQNMACITDVSSLNPPDSEFEIWLDWVREDLDVDDYKISEDRLGELGRILHDSGLSAGSAALKIADLLDLEEDERKDEAENKDET